jgi:hypothetical protein
MLTARDATITVVTSETELSIIIRILALLELGEISAGLNAVAVQNERNK